MIVSTSYLAIILIALGVLVVYRLQLGKKKRHSQYKNVVLVRSFSVNLTAK